MSPGSTRGWPPALLFRHLPGVAASGQFQGSGRSRKSLLAAKVGAFSGGAWHPDSPRVGVPGILSGSAMMDVPPRSRKLLPEAREGGGATPERLRRVLPGKLLEDVEVLPAGGLGDLRELGRFGLRQKALF